LSEVAEAETGIQIYDTSKAAKTFGINFRTFDEVLKDYTEFAFSYEK